MRRLSEVAARCSLTLVALGAGTAPGEPAGNEDGILVRFDLMRGIRPPERGAGWVEAEPGATWLDLDKELRRTGEGLAVYPTSAPRATVGGWLATVGGLGVGSFEYGRLRENVLSASVVTRGGGLREVGGEELGHFFGPGRATGIVVGARLRTRRADADLPFAAAFPGPDDAVEAVEELVASAAPLWHLALVSPVMAARGLRTRCMLFGAYPRQRDGEAWWELRRRVLEAHGGTELDSPEAWRVWGERFCPVEPSRPAPGVVREYVPRGTCGGRSSNARKPPCSAPSPARGRRCCSRSVPRARRRSIRRGSRGRREYRVEPTRVRRERSRRMEHLPRKGC